MKESISYTFLLNIVIVFIFVCFAIIMGILSYYRAFRANEAIIESIEKYEGYNCASQTEISRKLNGIGYNTPFNVTCDGKDKPCTTDSDNNYAVISYNLDGPISEKYVRDSKISGMATKKTDTNGSETNSPIIGIYANDNEMSSIASTDKDYPEVSTKHYQYGVYTYMYVDLPIVSKMIKLSFYSKTNVMYEFRDLSSAGTTVFDERMIPKDDEGNEMDIGRLQSRILADYVSTSTGKSSYFQNVNSNGYDARKRAQYDVNGDGIIDARDGTLIGGLYKTFYSKFGTCNEKKLFENY